MKKSFIIQAGTAFLLGILLFAGCEQFISPSLPSAEGNVIIQIEDGGSAKTLFPSLAFTRYVISFSSADGLEAPSDITLSSSDNLSASVKLAAGNWKVKVDAYVEIGDYIGVISADEYRAASSEEEFTVTGGKQTRVPIDIRGEIGEFGTEGVFAYDITLLENAEKAELSLYKFSGSDLIPVPEAVIDILESSKGFIKLPSGYYILRLVLENGESSIVKVEVVHINNNLITTAGGEDYTFTLDGGDSADEYTSTWRITTQFSSAAEVEDFLADAGLPTTAGGDGWALVTGTVAEDAFNGIADVVRPAAIFASGDVSAPFGELLDFSEGGISAPDGLKEAALNNKTNTPLGAVFEVKQAQLPGLTKDAVLFAYITEGSGGGGPVEPVVVEVSPGTAYVKRGASHQFYADVTGMPDNMGAQIYWEVYSTSGQRSPETRIGEDGILYVDSAEPLNYLTVRAMVIHPISGEEFYDLAEVTVTDENVEPPAPEVIIYLDSSAGIVQGLLEDFVQYFVQDGKGYYLSAEVSGDGFSQDVEWTIVTPDKSSETTIDKRSDGRWYLWIDPLETVNTLTIRAASTQDSAVYNEVDIKVVHERIYRTGTDMMGDDFTVQKGGSASFNVGYFVSNGSGGYKISSSSSPIMSAVGGWTIVEKDITPGTSIGDYWAEPSTIRIATDETRSFITIRAVIDVPTMHNGYTTTAITERIYIEDGSVEPEITSVEITPKQVTMEKGGQAIEFSALVSGTNNPSQAVKWDILEYGSTHPDTEITNASNDELGYLHVDLNEPNDTLTIRATSEADPSKYGEVTVYLTGGGSVEPDELTVTLNRFYNYAGLNGVVVVYRGNIEDLINDLMAGGNNDEPPESVVGGGNATISQDGSADVSIELFGEYSDGNYGVGVIFDGVEEILYAQDVTFTGGQASTNYTMYEFVGMPIPDDPGEGGGSVEPDEPTVTLSGFINYAGRSGVVVVYRGNIEDLINEGGDSGGIPESVVGQGDVTIFPNGSADVPIRLFGEYNDGNYGVMVYFDDDDEFLYDSIVTFSGGRASTNYNEFVGMPMPDDPGEGGGSVEPDEPTVTLSGFINYVGRSGVVVVYRGNIEDLINEGGDSGEIPESIVGQGDVTIFPNGSADVPIQLFGGYSDGNYGVMVYFDDDDEFLYDSIVTFSGGRASTNYNEFVGMPMPDDPGEGGGTDEYSVSFSDELPGGSFSLYVVPGPVRKIM